MRLSLMFSAVITAVLSFGLPASAEARLLINVDKAAQQVSVSVDGVVRHTWPVSTGRAGRATPNGTFTPFRLEEDHYSKEWDDAPMPHSIFFTKTGHAIHGSHEVKKLGSPASAGCVRLAPANAATLFALVKEKGLANTKVVISGEEPSPALVAKRGGAPDLAQRSSIEPRRPYGDPLELRAQQRMAAPDRDIRRSRVDDYVADMRRRYMEERFVERRQMPPRFGFGGPHGWYRGGYAADLDEDD